MDVVDLAACGDLDGVKEALADAGTTPEQVNSIDKDGRSALHYSCLNDDVKLLEILLADDRTDVTLRTPRGDTCLHLASLYASQRAMKMLFTDERGLALLNEQNQWQETPLHLCAGSGDKDAVKAAQLLLDQGAAMDIADKWGRGPYDVSRENGENGLVKVFEAWLEDQDAETRAAVEKITTAFRSENQRSGAVMHEDAKAQFATRANMLKTGLAGALAGLKKVSITEKTMFAKAEGHVADSASGKPDARSRGKVLSKLIDFPGDVEEIENYLADAAVDAGGADAYGLTALHKFASWNKVELIEMILPHLSKEDINAQDPEGKTALHWACEMASVAAVTRLVACPDVDPEVKDKKGRTPLALINGGDDGPIVARVRKALTGSSEKQ
ncbi:Ankyrin repeat domain-containing protein 6 [Hondaea fermentalgiana]|uniref:Ankyrin repeat domain-containing protein 6 n=1 Tax=Hondaea fermentalgiana TaxID=2315210 RepID=A0A2R5GB17_9STRA|nr:Ankyrin repeat domain-containing protein 6 [Hondaea fermentalgiana]|eukprot:GBG28202.1 Ankyrin repeat domain-containing protein 6 [Hondaea fermentalgiana]